MPVTDLVRMQWRLDRDHAALNVAPHQLQWRGGSGAGPRWGPVEATQCLLASLHPRRRRRRREAAQASQCLLASRDAFSHEPHDTQLSEPSTARVDARVLRYQKVGRSPALMLDSQSRALLGLRI